VESQIAAADVVVIMGGYNSVWESAGAGKRPIIVPRAGGGNEQPLRAARLAARGLATVIPQDELTPERLAAAVMTELTQGVSPAHALPFGGLERAGQTLAALLRR
jgi:predicted glycosyltransferase